MVGQKLESPSVCAAPEALRHTLTHASLLQIVRTLLDVKAVPQKPQYHIASDVPLVLYECGWVIRVVATASVHMTMPRCVQLLR